MPAWMSFEETIKRTGSFEALLPYLRDRRVLARHDGLYSWPDVEPESGPGEIPPAWWAEARIDPDTGRVLFTRPGMYQFFYVGGRGPPSPPPPPREVMARGVEFERDDVERWFIVGKLGAVDEQDRTGTNKGRGGRPVEYSWPEWKQALDTYLKTHPLPSEKQRLVEWSEAWFKRQDGAVPNPRSLRRHLNKHYYSSF